MKPALLRRACRVLAAVSSLAVHAQVVRVAGGVSSVENGKGAIAALYEGDSSTQIGVGYADGIRVGASRDVRVGNSSLTIGDTAIALKLPTDLQDAPRILRARGALLQSIGTQSNTQVMAGVTGNSFGNAYLSTVEAANPIAVFTTGRTFGRLDLSGLQIQGVRSSSLASMAYHPNRSNLLALTAGMSAGSPILRVAAHHGEGTEHFEASYTSGQLRLQPEPSLGNANLERIGLNLSAAKHIKPWLLLDAGRHEYATSDASENPVWSGVTASRSHMVEFGASLRLPGGLQATARVFQSTSGAQHTRGEALLMGWRGHLWDAHFTTVRSGTYKDALPASPGAVEETSSRANLLDASQRVLPRLLFKESVNLGGGTRSVEFGGVYDGNNVSVSLGQREVFIPFGARVGFHQLMVISVRLRLHDSQVGIDTIRGGGLPAAYGVSAESYYGELNGEHPESNRNPAMPKFAVQGIVLNQEKQPLRGAAVAVGRQTVYTDSQGHFLARIDKNAPVVVALKASEFLTTQRYTAVSQPLTVTPQRAVEDRPVELHAALSLAPASENVLAAPSEQKDSTSHVSRLDRALTLFTTLGRQMLHLSLHRTDANTQL